MKKRSRFTLRELLLACCLLAAFALLTCMFYPGRLEKKAFQDFSKTLYEQEMTADPISLHYSLAHPEAFSLQSRGIPMPVYVPGSELNRAASAEVVLKDLRSLKTKHLPEEDRFACACLERSLNLTLQMAHFPYYSDPLIPSGGMQSQLPILLSEYAFRTREDVDEYLRILGQSGEFLSSLLTYEKERAASGVLPALSALRDAEKECDEIVTLEALRSGTHFLQTSFQQRLSVLAERESLSKETQTAYVIKNDEILKTVIYPAYQNLKQGLLALEPQAKEERDGLFSLPGGKSYYASLLASETGSAKTPEEVRALLEKTLVREWEAISNLSKAYPECTAVLRSGRHSELGFSDASVILEDLKQRMQKDFPALCFKDSADGNVGTGASLPDALVKTVSGELSPYCAPAFYLTSPLDDVSDNVIYVNPKSAPDGLELYVTLAHEGYPGHLYQNAFAATHFLSMEESRLRQLLGCGGYLEGWATYAESLAYNYAADVLTQQGRREDAVCAILEKHNRSLQLCLYSLLDVKINYDGATLEELNAFLAPFGIRDEATLRSIRDYVCDHPCNYLKYYLGYLEILELKEEAKKLWGEAYQDLRFHSFLLENGPADFENLRKIIQ